MGTIKYFITECKNFSRNNWWVYIIYFLLLVVIFFIERQDLLQVIIITSIHFFADIFIMMMFNAYAHSDYSRGTYYQIVSLFLFVSLKIYTGFDKGGWQYLMADPIYILAAIKNYQIDVKRNDLRIINTISMTMLSLVILSIVFILSRKNPQLDLLSPFTKLIQTIGIFLFAIALATTANEKLRYEISLVGLLAMVVGSAFMTADSLMKGNIVGLSISYTLLPLTVLIFYLKKWTIIMKNKELSPVADVAIKPQ